MIFTLMSSLTLELNVDYPPKSMLLRQEPARGKLRSNRIFISSLAAVQARLHRVFCVFTIWIHRLLQNCASVFMK